MGHRSRHLEKPSAILFWISWVFIVFSLLQLDTEYRKKWDALVIKLEVIERDVVSGSEVLHWVTHFPVSIFTTVFTSITSMWGRILILPILFFSIRCTPGIMFMFDGIAWIRKTM